MQTQAYQLGDKERVEFYFTIQFNNSIQFRGMRCAICDVDPILFVAFDLFSHSYWREKQ